MTISGVVLEALGYALVAGGYALMSVLLIASYRKKLRGLILATASVATALWGAAYAWGTPSLEIGAFHVFLLEFTLDLAWLGYLGGLLVGAAASMRYRLLRFGGVLIAAGIIATGLVLEWLARNGRVADGADQLLVLGQIVTALAALVGIEQIYRNARRQQRRDLKYLCIGVGAMFGFDLLLYSNAIVVGEISAVGWAARGYVVAMAGPFIAFAVKRSPAWSGGIFVSRQIVFHTATVFGAGLYLTLIGFAGQLIRQTGGEWASVGQLVFFSAAIIALAAFISSDRVRSRVRVFISKHFYQNKYDYRQEWLRLIQTLTSDEESLPLRKRAVKALADIIGAPAGILWLQAGEEPVYRAMTGWNLATVDREFSADESLPRFLDDTGWIIEAEEYRSHPERYEGLDFEMAVLGGGKHALLVPLFNSNALLGFVLLAEPGKSFRIDYEDRDLLKTAGKQIASYLAQETATERLAQSRQFEAFNKLTAYIMHDLKNVMAQQSLVVTNARKHRDNPEFIDDAIETIRAGVNRMRRVIEQLEQSGLRQKIEKVEIGAAIMRAISDCSLREPVPRGQIGDQRIWVEADRERLQMAIYHAIRNAQDATPPEGEVTVAVRQDDGECIVEIRDTGAGMTPEFVRDRLFRPFDSTKGTSGMGIGAYQIRETIRGLGGSVDVDSEVGRGTRFILRLRSSSE